MDNRLTEIVDYIAEECNESDASMILDKAHEIVMQLIGMGENGVLIANVVAAQLNDHTMQQPYVIPTLH